VQDWRPSCSIAPTVVKAWNGAASELNGAVFTMGD
jgi:hypothetical protein